MADHTDGMTIHLAHRDATLVAISRAPLAEIERFRKRMGWQFKWVSSHGTDFNYDFGVSFTPEERAKGKVDYNYGSWPSAVRGIARRQRVRQRRSGRCLPHLLDLRPRRGGDDGHLSDARSHAEGPRRGRREHGMGAPSRQLRAADAGESRAGGRLLLLGTRVRVTTMTDVSMFPVVRHDASTCIGGGGAAPGLAFWLGLAAAPTFALMALWTAFFNGQPDMLCMATLSSSPMSGMTIMYLLMSAFHSLPWLKLISCQRKGAPRKARVACGNPSPPMRF